MDSLYWWHDTAAGGDVHVAFTSVRAGNLARHVGDEDVEQIEVRRRALQQRMGVEPGTLRFLDQVHSATVLDAAAHPASPGAAPTGDAWFSRAGAEPLAIMVADCLPVLMVGRTASGGTSRAPGGEALVTAAAHAGRAGLLDGVLENTVAALHEYGAERIQAWIGPGACGSCYEVPAAMRDELAVRRPAIASETTWGTPALDLRSEAEEVLRGRGVEVRQLAGCTIEDDTLFSHRRAPGEGRFAGLVWRAR
ncbi:MULTISPECIES: polyphenol oxidase family protein [Actinomycetes]|uniref:polyphenol oxidase family protein n=1 Tax=Actinomycetes TaxID=1760 RepID=UPI0031D8A200